MATTDAAFLTEVENFLISYELPPLPVLNVSKIEMSTTRNSTRSRKPKDTVERELKLVNERKRRREYREKKQSERENLHKKIEKLQLELEKVKEDKLACEPTWKTLAKRQLAARLSSEAEQKQLCIAIGVQTALMQEFRCLIHNSGLDEVGGSMVGGELDSYEQKRIRIEPSDTDIFAIFIRELDDVYCRTDATLMSWGLNTEENWDSPIETWNEDAASGFFQFRSKLTMPFNHREICQCRWQAAHLSHRQQSREQYDEVEDPENTLALKFRVTTRLISGKVGTALQRVVVRRYEKDEQMVLVWRLFTEGEGVFRGMNSDETGWGVATPVKGTSKVGTVIRTCVHNVPMHVSNKTEVKQFNSKLLEWGLENNENVTTGLERLLIK